MASVTMTGSPRSSSSRRSTPNIKLWETNNKNDGTPTSKIKASIPTPLQSNILSNLQPTKHNNKSTVEVGEPKSSDMENILARLRQNDSRKSGPQQSHKSTSKTDDAFDKLMTTLHDQNKTLKKQEKDLHDDVLIKNKAESDRHSSSEALTPATDSFPSSSSIVSHASDTIKVDSAEMLRVKQELEAAKSVISRQEQELAESRNLKHTIDQAIGTVSDLEYGLHPDISDQTIGHLQSAFNASARPFSSRSGGWHPQGASRVDYPESFAPAGYGRGRSIWNSQTGTLVNGVADPPGNTGAIGNLDEIRGYGGVYGNLQGSGESSRAFSGSSINSLNYDPTIVNELSAYGLNPTMRRNQSQMRSGSRMTDPVSPYGGFPDGLNSLSPPPGSSMSNHGQYNYGHRGTNAPVSPVSGEFSATIVPGLGNPWPLANTSIATQTYVTPLEPMNYRRLLDKSVSCDWKYIVDKIVCNNDQQASIFLQQKLKVGTAEQKFEIVEAIVNQAYPLMINRFGNFLIQRCFEHGTPEQVIAIANAIHGNVLSLSMDPFGCHVIQKAFDSVPESHKADMVRELLRRIPDTVIHRYACHVWQKLFELRWSGEPPQIMLKVNEALRGMWHEVALGETGSLVVQNIFENCVEEEKRPAIEEVIANIDLIAHGQFGNWCIQHLCEHGSPPDKRRVIDHILANSYNYSIDQFASKVVEKCLKIGGLDFLERYLGVITTAHPDRPRIPLIDIAGDQYGNYLIQWVLTNTHHHQREQVAVHIRKHMVSLRGSKFGSRVAMLCCNPNAVTRPGSGAIVNPYGAPGQPRSPWPRFR